MKENCDQKLWNNTFSQMNVKLTLQNMSIQQIFIPNQTGKLSDTIEPQAAPEELIQGSNLT